MRANVLVTGANGQLGKTLQKLYKENEDNIKFTFATKEELNITDFQQVQKYFSNNNFDYCINCAAYTNVEQAEKTPDIAFNINAEAVKNLAKACKKVNTILIHISTDYVFDGEKESPYTELDLPNPINEYGKSKLLGEQYIQEILKQYFIIRTSWLYSNFKKNFLKTIIKNINDNIALKITTSQVGSPTSTYNLAKFIYFLINSKSGFGLYNFTDKGEVTWYGFAKTIVNNYHKSKIKLISPINGKVSGARRPNYSSLNNNKRLKIFRSEVLLDNAIKETISLL